MAGVLILHNGEILMVCCRPYNGGGSIWYSEVAMDLLRNETGFGGDGGYSVLYSRQVFLPGDFSPHLMANHP